MVKGVKTPAHPTVRTIDECSICMPRTMFNGAVKYLLGESAKGSEDQDHITVLLAICRVKVFAAKRCNREWVILKHRNSRHPQVDVLTRLPSNLGRDCDLDCVLWHESYCCFLTHKP